jgi:hypothetical protein
VKLTVGRDGAEARKERLQRIARTVQAALHKDNKVSLSKTISFIQYDMGLTRQKVQEYLEILRDLGQFTLDLKNDEITRVIEENTDSAKEGGSPSTV